MTVTYPNTACAERLLEPELLDQLDPTDPEAVRSRRDLVWINRLMATEGWILSQLGKLVESTDTVIELGAGEGLLLSKVQRGFPKLRCLGYDLTPRPAELPGEIEWVSGDFMGKLDSMPLGDRTVVLANLILHHFDAADLERMREVFGQAGALLLVEPDRSKLSLWLERCILPFVGPVTRSDMMTSIRAGFAKGELEGIFGKQVIEESIWLGGRRLLLQ